MSLEQASFQFTKFQGMLPYIIYTDYMRSTKGYKILPYTPYGLKLGVEFNRIGYESGEDFVLFLIQDLELNIVLLS